MNEFSKQQSLKLSPAFVGGALVGAVVFCLIFGFSVLNPLNDAWLWQGGAENGAYGDLTQHYMGWRFFRESSWSFPFGLTENILYPQKVSMIYTDSIPVFALLFRCFAGILPKTFQYFGWWGLICYMLQGGFGVMLLAGSSEEYWKSLFAGAFFALSPLMLDRMFYHTALAAHWMILCAFCLWRYRKRFQSPLRYAACWIGLTALTVAVNLYFTPIIAGICFCCMLDDALFMGRWKYPLSILLLSSAGAVLAMLLLGVFYGGASGVMGGLGVFSANLNSFWNSMGSSGLLRDQPLVYTGQREGFACLGVSGIFLALVGLCFWISAKKEKRFSMTAVPILFGGIVFFLLALSPTVTFGGKVLFEVPLPEQIQKFLSLFRSSGRFLWPIYYGLLFGAMHIIIKKSPKAFAGVFLPLCLLVQVVEFQPAYMQKNELFTREPVEQSELTSPVWEELAENYEHFRFGVPLWDVYVCPDAGYKVGKFALKHHMTLGGVYFSRDFTPISDSRTAAEYEALKSGESKMDTVYLFLSADRIPEGVPLYYYEADGLLIGTPRKLSGFLEWNALEE